MFNVNMVDKYLTEEDITLLETRLKEVFVTKDEFTDYKSDLFDKLDEIIALLFILYIASCNS